MKLTDLAIVFQLFFICLVVVIHTKGSYLHGVAMGQIMYNNVMDGIVEDSLNAGYVAVDGSGQPIVDLSQVVSCFVAENDLYSSDDRQILVYIQADGFYIWDSDKSASWSGQIDFSEKESTVHEKKVAQIMKYLKDTYELQLNIPFNDGETWGNTVEEYALLAISYNRNFDIKSFSGAKIHR